MREHYRSIFNYKVIIVFILMVSTVNLYAQNFTSSNLKNVTIANPTSLEFGPDGKLYVAQQDGYIKVFTIQKNASNDYTTTATETISLVRNIPNYNDDGTPAPEVKKRQVTGLTVTGTAENPIIYVSSSDSRIGAGAFGDINLCTNSGVISKLYKEGGTWKKMDLVRGLPRSEENHSVNGLVYDKVKNMLYITVAGNTNAGGPSKLFTYHSEYALSAAILSVNLTMIEALPTKDATGTNPYKYDLPTLDDPTRPNLADGSDPGDPFGGNDGLNMAIIDPNGPVQVYAPGFRNPYDIVLTKTPGKERRLYTVDNGANPNWGGHPHNEGPEGNVTNNYVNGEPGSTGPGPNDPMVNNKDAIHFIGNVDTYVPGSYYGGHPNPVRANPTGAGLYTHEGPIEGGTRVWRVSKTDPTHPLPVNWPPLPVDKANPIEGDFINPGEGNTGAIISFSTSTNGLCEYTASNFNGTMQGDLLAAGFNGDIYRVRLNEAGNQTLNAIGTAKVNQDAPFASGFGTKPLDVTAQGDNDIFPGTIWVAVYASNAITVFEPKEIECTGVNSAELDEDGDGYTNADEIANKTNPCSASSKPNDFDGDLISDLNDPDDDNDGIPDTQDPFAIDADNGLQNKIPIELNLFNNSPGTGFFGVGFTGLMTNGTTDYLNAFDEENMVVGGAAGVLTIENVPEGDAEGSFNNQLYGFQFGVKVSQETDRFTIVGNMPGAYFNNNTPIDNQSQGIYIGTGDMDNFISITLNANGGKGGIRVCNESNGTSVTQQYDIPNIPNTSIDLFLSVNPDDWTVQPRYKMDGGSIINLGGPLTVSDKIVSEVFNGPKAMAAGIISTSRSSGTPFNATWDYIKVLPDSLIIMGKEAPLVAENFTAYPNPFGSSVKINFGNVRPKNVKIDVRNNLGANIKEFKIKLKESEGETEIDLSTLPPGIYYLNISTNKGDMHGSIKLVKEH
ncbi:MAG TPA: T9SS type A sorting domain-containing protein [Cytophagaceae bacterium]